MEKTVTVERTCYEQVRNRDYSTRECGLPVAPGRYMCAGHCLSASRDADARIDPLVTQEDVDEEGRDMTEEEEIESTRRWMARRRQWLREERRRLVSAGSPAREELHWFDRNYPFVRDEEE